MVHKISNCQTIDYLVEMLNFRFVPRKNGCMVVWEEQERTKKEEERRDLERETKRKIRENERREIDKEMIQRHRRNQNEIRGQSKFVLEKELRNKVRRSFMYNHK